MRFARLWRPYEPDRDRHQIAHRLDRNQDSGRGQHGALSISRQSVQIWIESIVRFSNNLFEEIEKLAISPESAS